jgi:hypothetical protein
MRWYLGIDGVVVLAMKILSYVLGVLAIIVFAILVIAAVLLMADAAHAQTRHAWQLGICVDDQWKLTTCRLVGGPLPYGTAADKQFCEALRDAMRSKINVGRVHCAPVLVDEERDA